MNYQEMNDWLKNERLTESISAAVKKHAIAIKDLTEAQTCEAFKQAILANDFKRFVTTDGKQQVIYAPYMGMDELRRENERLRELLSDIYHKLKEYNES